jgi:hypothetical protein
VTQKQRNSRAGTIRIQRGRKTGQKNLVPLQDAAKRNWAQLPRFTMDVQCSCESTLIASDFEFNVAGLFKRGNSDLRTSHWLCLFSRIHPIDTVATKMAVKMLSVNRNEVYQRTGNSAVGVPPGLKRQLIEPIFTQLELRVVFSHNSTWSIKSKCNRGKYVVAEFLVLVDN